MEGHLDYLIAAYVISFALLIGYRVWVARRKVALTARQKALEEAGARRGGESDASRTIRSEG